MKLQTIIEVSFNLGMYPKQVARSQSFQWLMRAVRSHEEDPIGIRAFKMHQRWERVLTDLDREYPTGR